MSGLISIIANKIAGISGKTKKLDGLNADFQNDKIDLQIDGQNFNNLLGDLNQMMVLNATMLVALAHTTMSDADYEKWVKEASKFKTGTPSAPVVIATFGFVSQITAGALVGKVIANLGKAFKAGVFNRAVTGADSAVAKLGSKVGNFMRDFFKTTPGVADDTALTVSGQATENSIQEGVSAEASAAEATSSAAGGTTEEAALAGEEAGAAATGTEAALATTGALGYALLGAGILATVGISSIISGIQASKTAKELNTQTNTLNTAIGSLEGFLTKVKTETTTVENEIVAQQNAFLKSMKGLSVISAPSFSYSNLTSGASTANNKKFIATMELAASYYGFLQAIREDWINFSTREKNRGVTPSWKTFKTYLTLFAPAGSAGGLNLANMSSKQIDELVQYVVKHSASMTKAQAANN